MQMYLTSKQAIHPLFRNSKKRNDQKSIERPIKKKKRHQLYHCLQHVS